MYSFSKPIMKVVSVILCISLVLGCFGALADSLTPNKVTDNAPPEMSSFVFTENGATLQAGAKVHVSVKAEDRSFIRYVSAGFSAYEPADLGDTSFSVRMEYNAATDAFEGEGTISDALANGDWYVSSVQAIDEYENRYSFGGTDYGSFTVVGNVEKPSILSYVTLAEEGQILKPGDAAHVTVKLTSKVDSLGFGLSWVNWDGSGSGTSLWSWCDYNEATGLWEGTFYFDSYMANGTYYIDTVEYDLDGSWFNFFEEEFGHHELTFTGGISDSTPPTIANVTFVENTTTVGPESILHFYVTVTDEDSGVNNVYMYFEGPTSSSMDGKKWDSAEYRKNHFNSSIGGSVDVYMEQSEGNIWYGEYILPDDMPNATYTLKWIDAWDQAGNYTSIDPEGYYFTYNGPDIVNENIAGFVKRCYEIILGRAVDETGLHDWGILLATGQKTAAEIINSLTESDEFKLKGLSNEKIVELMYKAMLGREADPAGKQAWVDVLNQGYPVAAVVNGFSGSVEFRGICKGYGIKPGTVNAGQPVQPVQPGNDKIKAFVTRCYSVILGRNPDPEGLNAWAQALATGVRKASEIIDGFVNSPEFLNKNLSKEEQVDVLYKAMLGRGADPAGKAAWVQVLNEGHPFAAVINGFCGSVEFTNLCAEYGIQPGSVAVKAAFVKREAITPEGEESGTSVVYKGYNSEYINEEKIRAFVKHCYESVLGRQGDEEGIANYTALIMDGKKTPKKVAYEFVFSPEFQGRLPGNEEFIRILYKLYLNRQPGAEELAGWVEMLEGGTSLEEIVNGFAESAEFRAIIKGMKE